MKKWLLFIIVLLLCPGCKTPKIATTETKTVTEIREVVRDTTITVPPDSAWLRAWLECDSLGNVLMRQLSEQKGSRSEVSLKLTSFQDSARQLKGALLDVLFVCDSLQIEIGLRDQVIERIKEEKERVYIEVKKPYPWWVKALTGFGGFFLVLVALAIYKRLR